MNNIEYKKKLFEFLSSFITENKKRKIEEILSLRTKYLTVILEDIFQPHNASAVVRSCDCFGIQDLHIIENKNKYTVNPDITLGSSKWVNMYKYSPQSTVQGQQLISPTEECLKQLKTKGYKIVATLPDEKYKTLEELDLSQKTAIIFGTEMEGLSDEAIKIADECVRIKMYGFTESLNISVSAALCIHFLSSRLRNSDIDWKLTDEEKIDTSLIWVKNIVKRPDLLEKEFSKKQRNLEI